MAASLQSQPHITGMNSDALTSRQHYAHDAHTPHSTTTGPQATMAIQTANNTRSFPVPPGPPSRTTNKTTHSCSPHSTPSRPEILHGIPCTEDLPAASRGTHTHVTSPAHSSSAMVYTAGPSTTAGTAPQIRILQPLVVHQTSAFAHKNTRPPSFVPPGHQPIQPRPHQGEGRLSIRLSSIPGFPDPWTPESAHACPWSMRLAVLAETLADLETMFDVHT